MSVPRALATALRWCGGNGYFLRFAKLPEFFIKVYFDTADAHFSKIAYFYPDPKIFHNKSSFNLTPNEVYPIFYT